MSAFGLKQVQKLKSFSPETRVSKGFLLFNWLIDWLSGNVSITFKLSLIIWNSAYLKRWKTKLLSNKILISRAYVIFFGRGKLVKIRFDNSEQKKKTQNEFYIVLFENFLTL